MIRNLWLRRLRAAFAGIIHRQPIRIRRARYFRPVVERLEKRVQPTVSLLSQFAGIAGTGSVAPPDTNGAAGSGTDYVETVNQTLRLSNKTTGVTVATDSFNHFLFTTGGLPHADGGSFLSDPVVVWDEQIQRFIVGDQDVNFNTHVSNFD